MFYLGIPFDYFYNNWGLNESLTEIIESLDLKASNSETKNFNKLKYFKALMELRMAIY